MINEILKRVIHAYIVTYKSPNTEFQFNYQSVPDNNLRSLKTG